MGARRARRARDRRRAHGARAAAPQPRAGRARDGSFLRSVLAPERGPGVAYLCHGAVRTKLPRWRGALEVEGGIAAWRAAGLPLER